MSNLVLTNDTAKDIISNNSERFKLDGYQVVDVFKHRERRRYTIIDNKSGESYEGIIEFNPETNAVLSVKQFNLIK